MASIGVNKSVKTSLTVICLRIGPDAVCLMGGALHGLGVEVDVQGPLSLGRAALDHKVDLIPYVRLDLSIIVDKRQTRRGC